MLNSATVSPPRMKRNIRCLEDHWEQQTTQFHMLLTSQSFPRPRKWMPTDCAPALTTSESIWAAIWAAIWVAIWATMLGLILLAWTTTPSWPTDLQTCQERIHACLQNLQHKLALSRKSMSTLVKSSITAKLHTKTTAVSLTWYVW